MSQVVLENQQEWLSELDLKALAAARIETLEAAGAPIRISANACEAVLSIALSMLAGRGLLENRDGLIRPRPESLEVLRYYANSIDQWRAAEAGPRADDPLLFAEKC